MPSAPWIPVPIDDPRLECLSQLGAGGGSSDVIVIEGELALWRAIEAGWRPLLVVATPACADRLGAVAAGGLAAVVDEAAVSRLVGYAFHRGCLGVVARVPTDLDGWRSAITELLERPSCRVVALDRIADPVNVGAVLRSARALGVDHVVLGRGCADPFSRRAVRASMGHALAQPLSVDVDLAACVAAFPALTWWATGSTDIALRHRRNSPDPPPRHLGLVFGNEGTGVAEVIASSCARRVAIATRPGAESLNVAAAAAILMWSVAEEPEG